jgi:fermentation-respiration switch protein FrsA (DUF1100 family)
MIRLFAPRPLLIVNGEKDPNNPLEGARLAFASARVAYHAAGADNKLVIDVAPGVGHQVTKRAEPRGYRMAGAMAEMKPGHTPR